MPGPRKVKKVQAPVGSNLQRLWAGWPPPAHLALLGVDGGAAAAHDVGLLEGAGALLEHRAVGLGEGRGHQGVQGEQQQQHLGLAPWGGGTGFIAEISIRMYKWILDL